MTLEFIHSVLGWCTLINMGILILWTGVLWCCGEKIHQLHGRFCHLTSEQFNMLHYGLMGVYKLVVLLFNAVPWVALHIVR